jgi:protocatechuate 3,4-dioxygenase beta subunit
MPSRRRFLGIALVPAAAAAGAWPTIAVAQSRSLPATPACETGGPTPRQTEGPYFKRSSPERASLVEPGMPGTPLVVTGRVLATDCRPIPKALIDVWQADDRGHYDIGWRRSGRASTRVARRTST